MNFPDFVREHWTQVSDHPLDYARAGELIALLDKVPFEGSTSPFPESGGMLDVQVEVFPYGGKTELLTVLWPLWIWEQNPSLNITLVTTNLNQMVTPFTKFGEMVMHTDNIFVEVAPRMFMNASRGEYSVRSVYTTLCPYYDVLIADELILPWTTEEGRKSDELSYSNFRTLRRKNRFSPSVRVDSIYPPNRYTEELNEPR